LTNPFHTVELSDPFFECAGLRLVTVKSRALGRRADVSLWIPRIPNAASIGTLVILLHGVYGSHWTWALKGGAHRTAQLLLDRGEIGPMVLAMPSDALGRDGTAYLTWRQAEDVEQWIVEEVPALARIAAPMLRSDTKLAIAGLSMGGFGALRLGAKHAASFSAIAAHSAITEIDDIAPFVEEPLTHYLACAPREELSPLYWLRRHRHVLPPLYFDCGTEDSLLESNRRLHHALLHDGIAHTYTEFPGGHNWPYWQIYLAQTLRHVNRQCHGGTIS
jgi:S-formylglutathione hydrolase FrmB